MNSLIKDERLDLPSASGLHRIVLCPGSFALEQQAKSLRVNHYEDKEASSGTRIHDALAEHFKKGAADINHLDDEEIETFELCLNGALNELEKWGEAEKVFVIEERLWLHNGLEPIFSGKADLIAIKGHRALIIDHKTSWGIYNHSDANWQLRALAVFAHANFKGLKEITVVINQPRVVSSPVSCTYDENDLLFARKLILNHLADARKSDAPRIPGVPQCDHCLAKSICSEAKGEIQKISTWKPVSPEDKANRLLLFEMAEKIIEAEKEQYALELASDPNSIPGYRVRFGKNKKVPVIGKEEYVKGEREILENRLHSENCFETRFVEYQKPSIEKIKLKKDRR